MFKGTQYLCSASFHTWSCRGGKMTLASRAKSVYIIPCVRGLSAAGSAPPCQGGGRGFEPRSPLHEPPGPVLAIGLLHTATWPSGKAEACKAFISGSNPDVASNNPGRDSRPGLFCCDGHADGDADRDVSEIKTQAPPFQARLNARNGHVCVFIARATKRAETGPALTCVLGRCYPRGTTCEGFDSTISSKMLMSLTSPRDA